MSEVFKIKGLCKSQSSARASRGRIWLLFLDCCPSNPLVVQRQGTSQGHSGQDLGILSQGRKYWLMSTIWAERRVWRNPRVQTQHPHKELQNTVSGEKLVTRSSLRFCVTGQSLFFISEGFFWLFAVIKARHHDLIKQYMVGSLLNSSKVNQIYLTPTKTRFSCLSRKLKKITVCWKLF